MIHKLLALYSFLLLCSTFALSAGVHRKKFSAFYNQPANKQRAQIFQKLIQYTTPWYLAVLTATFSFADLTLERTANKFTVPTILQD